MAVIAQSAGAVKIDKAAGTLVDISGQVASCSIATNRNAGTYQTLGSQWGAAVDGKGTWTVEMEIYMTTGTSESEAYDIFTIWNTTASPGGRSIEVYTPDATTTGSFKFSGEVRLQTMSEMVQLSSDSNQPQRFRVTLLGDGTLTKAAVTP